MSYSELMRLTTDKQISKIVEHFGGTRITISRQDTSTMQTMATIVDKETLQEIRLSLNSATFSIPTEKMVPVARKLTEDERIKRDFLIQLSLSNLSLSIKSVAKVFGLTERGVSVIVKRYKMSAPNQLK